MTARGSFLVLPVPSQVSTIRRPVLGHFVPAGWEFLPRIRVVVALTLRRDWISISSRSLLLH